MDVAVEKWITAEMPSLTGLALERRDGVDGGLGFLEVGDGLGAAQAADAALLRARG
jgi:hypothetical protein